MHRGQARPLSGMVKPSQLVIAEREVPVTPFDIGAGALEHVCKRSRLLHELMLRHWAQRAQGPTWLKEWGAEALGERTQWRSCCHCPGQGHVQGRTMDQRACMT